MANSNIDLDALDAQEEIQESKAQAKVSAPAYSREQILASVRYSNRRDALGVVLKPGRLYTDAEIEAALKHYYKKGVK